MSTQESWDYSSLWIFLFDKHWKFWRERRIEICLKHESTCKGKNILQNLEYTEIEISIVFHLPSGPCWKAEMFADIPVCLFARYILAGMRYGPHTKRRKGTLFDLCKDRVDKQTNNREPSRTESELKSKSRQATNCPSDNMTNEIGRMHKRANETTWNVVRLTKMASIQLDRPPPKPIKSSGNTEQTSFPSAMGRRKKMLETYQDQLNWAMSTPTDRSTAAAFNPQDSPKPVDSLEFSNDGHDGSTLCLCEQKNNHRQRRCGHWPNIKTQWSLAKAPIFNVSLEASHPFERRGINGSQCWWEPCSIICWCPGKSAQAKLPFTLTLPLIQPFLNADHSGSATHRLSLETGNPEPGVSMRRISWKVAIKKEPETKKQTKKLPSKLCKSQCLRTKSLHCLPIIRTTNSAEEEDREKNNCQSKPTKNHETVMLCSGELRKFPFFLLKFDLNSPRARGWTLATLIVMDDIGPNRVKLLVNPPVNERIELQGYEGEERKGFVVDSLSSSFAFINILSQHALANRVFFPGNKGKLILFRLKLVLVNFFFFFGGMNRKILWILSQATNLYWSHHREFNEKYIKKGKRADKFNRGSGNIVWSTSILVPKVGKGKPRSGNKRRKICKLILLIVRRGGEVVSSLFFIRNKTVIHPTVYDGPDTRWHVDSG